MARLTSVMGKAVGKIGAIVYSTTSGEIIAREYNPNVANPNTPAQTNQRAKFKLMSQLSASLSPVIAIPKEGLVSSRNGFVKRNSELAYANDGIAQVTYENLQITAGTAGFPALQVTRSSAEGIKVQLAEDAHASASRVVYAVFKKSTDNSLQFVGSSVVNTAGDDGKFAGSFPYVAGDIVVYGYGMKDKSGAATAKYGDYEVQNGEDIAKLIVARSISSSDYTFTKTRGTTLLSSESATEVVPDGQARVYVTASGNGTVSGAGTFAIGSEVTVIATAQGNSDFLGWKINGQSGYVSTLAQYTFTLTGTTDLVAIFQEPSGDSGFDQN